MGLGGDRRGDRCAPGGGSLIVVLIAALIGGVVALTMMLVYFRLRRALAGPARRSVYADRLRKARSLKARTERILSVDAHRSEDDLEKMTLAERAGHDLTLARAQRVIDECEFEIRQMDLQKSDAVLSEIERRMDE